MGWPEINIQWEDCKKCPEKICDNKILNSVDKVCYIYRDKHVHIHPPCWTKGAKVCAQFYTEEDERKCNPQHENYFSKHSRSLSIRINHIIENYSNLPLESTLALLRLKQEVKNDKQKRKK